MKRKLVPLTLALLLIVAMAAPPTLAAGSEKYLKAFYGVQILYNNQVLSSTNQPFIVDGTTYVPLRMLMDSFGDKQISWDGLTKKVIIASTTSQTEAMYMQQINSRNAQITELQAKVKTLEAQLVAAKDAVNSVDLDNLEDDLNDDYGDFEDLDLTITLSGDEEEIGLKIAISKADWDTLTESEQENLLQDICDDIWDEAEDADINGTIKAGTTTLDSFSVEADDDVTLEDLDLDALEDDLNDDYGDYEGLDFTYALSGDTDKITVKIDVDETEWKAVSFTTTEKEDLLQDICEDLWDEAEDADIYFSIKDGADVIKTLTVHPDGTVNL